MSITSQVSNIEIVSVDAQFGNQHLVCIDTVAAGDLAGTSFNISSRTTDYYVWLDDGVASDPDPVGKTAIAVTILDTETAAELAVKIAAAIESEDDFNAVEITDKGQLIVEVKGLGAPNLAFSDVDSGFTFTVLREGSLIDLGFLDGDVELTLDEQVFDITSHQTGTQVIGSLRTGITVGPISMSLKETTAAKLKEFMEASAAVEYTVGANTVTAIGSLSGSKQFSNTFIDAKTLVLHPTKKGDAEIDEDFCFWKAYPNLNSLTFSGESNRMLSIDFNIFLDERRVNQANQVVIGTDNGGNWQDNFLKKS